eukprot:6157268-Karenia_brevis.AAC.1
MKQEEGILGKWFCSPGQEEARSTWTSFVVRCPTCKAAKDIGQCNLRKGGAWSSIPCKRCGRVHKASKWQCPCDKAWIECAIHFQAGLKCRSPKPRRRKDA